ncbi:metal ABC transporter permease [Hydrogenibacillus schlegelii]
MGVLSEMVAAFWTYPFLRHALLAGLISGFVAPLIGSFVVVRRLSIIADALAHVMLAGVALGYLLGATYPALSRFPVVGYGTAVALIAALLIERLRTTYRSYSELAISIIMSAGIGLSIVLIGLARGINVDLIGLLFGNILSVTAGDVLRIAALALVVVGTVALFYKELLFLSFDEEAARVSGVPHRALNFIFSALIALVISVAMQVVGTLLISALITLPVAAALRLAKSFRALMLLSIVFAETSVLVGLAASYAFDLATGGSIVLVAAGILLAVLAAERLRLGHRRREPAIRLWPIGVERGSASARPDEPGRSEEGGRSAPPSPAPEKRISAQRLR